MTKKKTEVKNKTKPPIRTLVEITKPKSSDYYILTDNELDFSDILPEAIELPLDNQGNLLSVFAYKINNKWYIE